MEITLWPVYELVDFLETFVLVYMDLPHGACHVLLVKSNSWKVNNCLNYCFLLRFLTWGTSGVPGGIEQPLCRAHVPYTYRAGLRVRNKHETCKCKKIELKAPGIQY